MSDLTRKTVSSSATNKLMEDEVSQLVNKIVGITNVSEDEALFALNDSNFDIAMAIDAVMKLVPDEKVHHKVSRRKKGPNAKDTSDETNEKDSNLKNARDESKDKSKDQTKTAITRRDKQGSNKAAPPRDSSNQIVKPLMEIQTGNWKETETKMMNGFGNHHRSNSDNIHRDRNSSSRRGRGRGTGGETGLSRADHNERTATGSYSESDFHNYDNDTSNKVNPDSASSFDQPFVVGTFDAKTVNMETEQRDRGGGRNGTSYDSFGSSGGGGRGRGSGRGGVGRYGGRVGGVNRNNTASSKYRDRPMNDAPMGMGGTNNMDNLWPLEEKWDVNSDGDWRGREFTRTTDETTVDQSESSLAPALAYFSDGSFNSVNTLAAATAALPLKDQISIVSNLGANSNTTPQCVDPSIKNESVMPAAATPISHPSSNADSSSFGITSAHRNFDQNTNSTPPQQSENLLLKFLNGQIGIESIEDSSNSNMVNSSANHFSNITNSNSNTQQTEDTARRFLNTVSASHLNNSQLNVNVDSKINNMASVPTTSNCTNSESVPDVPPGFTEALNSGNLEFGRPPSTLQQYTGSVSNRRQLHYTSIPAAAVELPSPVSSFTIGKPVNFGEIDSRYLNNRSHVSNNISSTTKQPYVTSTKNGGGTGAPGAIDIYGNSRFSSMSNSQVSFANASSDISQMQVQVPFCETLSSNVFSTPRTDTISKTVATASSTMHAPGSIVSQSSGSTSRLSSAYASSTNNHSVHHAGSKNNHNNSNIQHQQLTQSTEAMSLSSPDSEQLKNFSHRQQQIINHNSNPQQATTSSMYQLTTAPVTTSQVSDTSNQNRVNVSVQDNGASGAVANEMYHRHGGSAVTNSSSSRSNYFPTSASQTANDASVVSISTYGSNSNGASQTAAASASASSADMQKSQQSRYGTNQHSNQVFNRNSSGSNNYSNSKQEDGNNSLKSSTPTLSANVANLMSAVAASAASQSNSSGGGVGVGAVHQQNNSYGSNSTHYSYPPHQQHQMQHNASTAAANMNSMGGHAHMTSPATGGYQLNYNGGGGGPGNSTTPTTGTATADSSNANHTTSPMLNSVQSNQQSVQARYLHHQQQQQQQSTMASTPNSHQYQIVSSNVSGIPTHNISQNMSNYTQYASGNNVRTNPTDQSGSNNSSGSNNYTMNLANSMPVNSNNVLKINNSRRLDDSNNTATNNSPSTNFNMSVPQTGTGPTGTPAMPPFFLAAANPYHTATNFGTSGAAPTGAFYNPAAAAAAFINPAAVFSPFNHMAQIQAMHQSPVSGSTGAGVATVQVPNSTIGPSSANVGNVSIPSSVSNGANSMKSMGGNVSTNNPNSTSAAAAAASQQLHHHQQQQQQQQAAFANNTGQYHQSVANSYFQTIQPHQNSNNGTNSADYMGNVNGGFNNMTNEYSKYGQQQQQQQQQQSQQQHNQNMSNAAVVAAATQNVNMAAAAAVYAASRGSANSGSANKNAIYANTNSEYSNLYHSKGLDKSGSGNMGVGMGPAGLSSTSPPQAAAANATPFNAYFAPSFGPSQTAAAAATHQQLYSHQFFQAAAAQNHLMQHDPRASAVAAAATGVKLPTQGGNPPTGSMSAAGIHGKHAHVTATGSQHASNFGAPAAASGSFGWHS